MRYTAIPMYFFEDGCPDWVGCKVTEIYVVDGELKMAKAHAVDKNWALDFDTRMQGAMVQAERALMDFMYPPKPLRALCELL